ncbi:MAG: thioredoxin family protein [Aristaeellaceae bacterium]
MSPFGFGKRKEEAQAPACCCGKASEGAATPLCAGSITGVKVLGAGCKTCHAQYENVKAAVQALGLAVEVEYITDMEKVMAYGAMSMPAIVVNEQVASMGKLLKPAEVEGLLRGLMG